MVGTAAEVWVNNESSGRVLNYSTSDTDLKFELLFDNYFVHSSILIRKSVFDTIGGYCEDRERQPPEDYELWSRVMRRFEIANLNEVLMVYREVASSMSRVGSSPFKGNLPRISSENISWASGFPSDSPDVLALSHLVHGVYEKIPKNITFSGLRNVISVSAQNIERSSQAPLGALSKLQRARTRRMLFRYLDFRSGGALAWIWILNGNLGIILRKIITAKRT